MKESSIQKVILERLSFVPNSFFFRTNNIGVPLKNGGFRPSPVKGLSDIIGVMNGRFVAIEVKVPDKKATLNQRVFLEGIRLAGGITLVAHSVDEVEEMLKNNAKTK